MSLSDAAEVIRRMEENDRREAERAARLRKRRELNQALTWLKYTATPDQFKAVSIVVDAINNPEDYKP